MDETTRRDSSEENFNSFQFNEFGQQLDLEPNLEFDDTELSTEDIMTSLEVEDNNRDSTEDHFLGLIEDNFEDCLQVDFQDIQRHQIVEVAGDDLFARKIITIYAQRLPDNRYFDFTRFLRYLMSTLDKYVENDYILVYFHFGLTSHNKPSLRWLWTAFRAFDRKYKKNLKSLFVVHPTSFVRLVSQLFTPVISAKFGRKLHYISRLEELSPHLHLEQLGIPEEVFNYDKKLNKKIPKSVSQKKVSAIVTTQQFRVSLQFIKENQNSDPIPRVVRSCVQFLDNETSLQTEGLFRRSANVLDVKKVQQLFDSGKEVNFEDYSGATHLSAALLKSFLRELEEPILTFDLFDDIIDFQRISQNTVQRLAVIKALICHKLPKDNYLVLEFVVKFLVKVMDRCDLNKMTASNLAIVFGPNLLWSRERSASLESITSINSFCEFLFKNNEQIFNEK